MSHDSVRLRDNSICLLLAIAVLGTSGCAAITNPVANGIPARLVPEELLAESQEDLEQVPLDWLRVERPVPYTLDTGDILGVFVEGALGERDQLPPVNFPQVAGLPPSTGFPIPIDENGDVPLPLVEDFKVHVAGMSIPEAREKIRNAYTGVEGGPTFLQEGKARIEVSLVRPRLARITVIREDAPNQRPSLNDPNYRLFGSSPSLGQRLPGTGQIEEIPEVEADVMTALARSGGMPGPTAQSEVIIYRSKQFAEDFQDAPGDSATAVPPAQEEIDSDYVIRIPLRIKRDTPRPFGKEDVRLYSGDIVFVPPRTTDVYYTGGLLPPREVPLPRDNDIRVVEAVLRAGGSIVSGGFSIGTFSTTVSLGSGIENSSPSLVSVLRRTPNGNQVTIRVDLNRALRDPRENLLIMPGDMIILQETPAEAVSRYLTGIFNVRLFTEIFTRGSASAQGQAVVP